MGLYDEVEIEDMDWDQEMHGYTYSCPCGDLFQITVVCFAGLKAAHGLCLLSAVLGRECFSLPMKWPGFFDTWLIDEQITVLTPSSCIYGAQSC